MQSNRMERRGSWKPLRIPLAVVLLALPACDAMKPNVYEPRREYVRVPPPPLDSVRAAPETVDVGGLRMAAGAYLWMDVMPSPVVRESAEEEPGPPLQGRIDIHPADSANTAPLPAGLTVVGAWVRSGDSIWPLRFLPGDTTRGTSKELVQHVGSRPPWLQRDSSVDVVLRLRRPSGPPVLLQVRRVPVITAG